MRPPTPTGTNRHLRRLAGAWLCVGLLVGGAACGPDEPDGGEVAAVDGAPVEIGERLLSIGTVEGDPAEMLHDVSPPFRAADGSVVVPLRSEDEIRIFTPEGDHIRTLGGHGEGPGEFRNLSTAWSCGDTIEAWDRGLQRITRFSPNDEVEVVTLHYDFEERPILDQFIGTSSGGWLLTSIISASLEEGERDEMTVHRFGADGDHEVDGFGHTPGMDRAVMPNLRGPLPLSPGARFHEVGGELYVAETLTPEVRVYDGAGGLARTINWEPERIWSPEEAFGRAVEVAEGDREQPVLRRDASFPSDWPQHTSPPDSVPVFSDFMVDDEGFFWIRPYLPERDALALGGRPGGTLRTTSGGEWRVLSPEGEEVGRVDVPDGFEPYQISFDEVVGVYRNELGVEFVHVYHLDRH